MIAALLVASTLAVMPSPTVTPTSCPSRSLDGWRAFEDGVRAGRETAIPSGAWLVTATVTATATRTRTPRPNPEATCVAVGHDWYYKDDGTYEMWALIPICDRPGGTPWPCVDSQIWVWTQRCGRCGLRREHEWKGHGVERP